MTRPNLSRGRSTNLLSDAGSKYGNDDDEMSHYMGQSALGGASNIGGGDVGSNVGGYNRTNHASAGGAPTAGETMGGRSSGSRRAAVLNRNNVNAGSGKDSAGPGRGVEQPQLVKQASQNYGLFLGGSSSVPPRPVERSRTTGPEARGRDNEGSIATANLGSEGSRRGGTGNDPSQASIVRDRSFPPPRLAALAPHSPDLDSRSRDSATGNNLTTQNQSPSPTS